MKSFFSRRTHEEGGLKPGTYSSYQEALEACVTPMGYQEETLASSVVAKTLVFSQQLDEGRLGPTAMRTALAFAPLDGLDGLTVLDYGGGSGFPLFCDAAVPSSGQARRLASR